MKRSIAVLSLTVLAGAFCLLRVDAQQASHAHAMPPGYTQGSGELLLCDGATRIPIPPDQAFPRPEAQKYADQLMDLWLKKHPSQEWIMAAAAPAPPPIPQEASQKLNKDETKQFEIYNDFSAREQYVWKQEYDKFVAEGNRIFHDAEAFGGTVGISCDMCHPNAANTHPETYPKYQVQLQRVVLLRDMINWCMEHPTKAKPLADDDPRMRAMEAYILAQRAGKVIEPNKH